MASTDVNVTQHLVIKLGVHWHFIREGASLTRCRQYVQPGRTGEEFTTIRGDSFCSACLEHPYTCPSCESHIEAECRGHECDCMFHEETCDDLCGARRDYISDVFLLMQDAVDAGEILDIDTE